MKHPITIENYNGSLESLAEDIGNLRYDALSDLLTFLWYKIEKDARTDRDRGRVQLYNCLHEIAEVISTAIEPCDKAWSICERKL